MRKSLLIMVGCLGLFILILLDTWQVSHWRDLRSQDLQAISEATGIRLESSIKSRFRALSALKALFLLHPRTQPLEFAEFAQGLIDSHQPVRALQYADQQTRVTYVYPPKGNEITISKPMVLIKDPKRGPYVQKALNHKKATLQGPFSLRQGGPGVVVRDPIYDGDVFVGLAIGVYDLPVLLEEAISGVMQDRMVFQFTNAQGKVFWGPESIPDHSYTRTIYAADQAWTMRTAWSNTSHPPVWPRVLIWVLGLGGLFAVLHAVRLSWENTQRLQATVESRTAELNEANQSLAREMAESKKMEKELRLAHKMESITSMTGGIAHEFNNLLGVIVGNAELAREELSDDAEARQFIQDIIQASLKGKAVIQHLLRFSRKTPSGKSPVDLHQVVRQSLESMEEEFSIDMETGTEASEGLSMINGNGEEIFQLTGLLVANAAQAMEGIENKRLLIRTSNVRFSSPQGAYAITLAPGDYVCMEVWDTGSGIEPRFLDRVFDPYFTTRDMAENLGMGLAVVQGIMLGHEGGVQLESEVGKGTTVRCYFPAIKFSGAPGSETE